MNVFLTSDHHFFHGNIIKYCSRPFRDVSHMNAEMLSRINGAVAQDDTLLIVGDLTAGLGGRLEELRSIIGAMHGKKLLIRGNHDHQPDEWYLASGFHRVLPHINLGGVLVTHFSLIEAVSRGIDIDALGTVEHVVHGHTHSVDTPDLENHFNVAVDRHAFDPVDYRRAIPENLQTPFIDSLRHNL